MLCECYYSIRDFMRCSGTVQRGECVDSTWYRTTIAAHGFSRADVSGVHRHMFWSEVNDASYCTVFVPGCPLAYSCFHTWLQGYRSVCVFGHVCVVITCLILHLSVWRWFTSGTESEEKTGRHTRENQRSHQSGKTTSVYWKIHHNSVFLL